MTVYAYKNWLCTHDYKLLRSSIHDKLSCAASKCMLCCYMLKTHTHMHIHTHTRTHAYTHTRNSHMHTHARTHTCTHTHSHTHSHTHTHIHSHTHTHTHTHTRTLTHTLTHSHTLSHTYTLEHYTVAQIIVSFSIYWSEHSFFLRIHLMLAMLISKFMILMQ